LLGSDKRLKVAAGRPSQFRSKPRTARHGRDCRKAPPAHQVPAAMRCRCFTLRAAPCAKQLRLATTSSEQLLAPGVAAVAGQRAQAQRLWEKMGSGQDCGPLFSTKRAHGFEPRTGKYGLALRHAGWVKIWQSRQGRRQHLRACKRKQQQHCLPTCSLMKPAASFWSYAPSSSSNEEILES